MSGPSNREKERDNRTAKLDNKKKNHHAGAPDSDDDTDDLPTTSVIPDDGALRYVRIPNCSICYEPLMDELRVTKCAHLFHNKCINQWFCAGKGCPMCRKPSSQSTTPSLHFKLEEVSYPNDSVTLHKRITDLEKDLIISKNKHRSKAVSWKDRNDVLEGEKNMLAQSSKVAQDQLDKLTKKYDKLKKKEDTFLIYQQIKESYRDSEALMQIQPHLTGRKDKLLESHEFIAAQYLINKELYDENAQMQKKAHGWNQAFIRLQEECEAKCGIIDHIKRENEVLRSERVEFLRKQKKRQRSLRDSSSASPVRRSKKVGRAEVPFQSTLVDQQKNPEQCSHLSVSWRNLSPLLLAGNVTRPREEEVDSCKPNENTLSDQRSSSSKKQPIVSVGHSNADVGPIEIPSSESENGNDPSTVHAQQCNNSKSYMQVLGCSQPKQDDRSTSRLPGRIHQKGGFRHIRRSPLLTSKTSSGGLPRVRLGNQMKTQSSIVGFLNKRQDTKC